MMTYTPKQKTLSGQPKNIIKKHDYKQYLFDVAPRQEQGGFHEEEALLKREQGPLVYSVVALDKTGPQSFHRTKKREFPPG